MSWFKYVGGGRKIASWVVRLEYVKTFEVCDDVKPGLSILTVWDLLQLHAPVQVSKFACLSSPVLRVNACSHLDFHFRSQKKKKKRKKKRKRSVALEVQMCSVKARESSRREHRWTDPELMVHSSVLRLVKPSGYSLTHIFIKTNPLASASSSFSVTQSITQHTHTHTHILNNPTQSLMQS